MAITIPFIFFGISAFLLNVVLGRMVAAQREQIATLKALGFPTARLVLHYMKLVFIIVLTGSALGVAAGCGFSAAMIESYRGFFRLPVLAFELTPWSYSPARRSALRPLRSESSLPYAPSSSCLLRLPCVRRHLCTFVTRCWKHPCRGGC